MLFVAAWATPAFAHGSVVLTLHGDGHGSVWLTADWADGHPITEPIGAVLTATSTSGQTVGPSPLQSTGNALTYSGTLATGSWTVTAEMGTPAIGRCQATMQVSPSAAPSSTRCAPPAAPAAPAASQSHVGWYVAIAVGAAAALAGLFFYARRSPAPARRRPRPAPSRKQPR